MFFQLKSTKSKMPILLVRPGPVKKFCKKPFHSVFHAAYPTAEIATGAKTGPMRANASMRLAADAIFT